ncbi:hypothetical protein F5Y18DRAFT_432733 [Xylariaceae sp. FL1019]|nr:hypothetical protein F5Y18DRAFT_432733 [Xylariaceae sp. FL1019]
MLDPDVILQYIHQYILQYLATTIASIAMERRVDAEYRSWTVTCEKRQRWA